MADISIETLDQLHARKSAKWRMFGPEVIPMGLAEMDLPIAEPIQRILAEMIAKSDLGYGGTAPELGEAFAGFSRRNWNWDLDPSQCWVVTDVAIAGIETMRRFCQPGDRVGISSPVYYNFHYWIEEVQAELVDVPLLKVADEWRLDLDGLQAAFADGMSTYILCNPHNPVGYIPSRQELEHLADLADEHGVLVISDEIHAPLVYSGQTFTPYLSVNAQARRTGVLITSASKAWNTAGLKCAQIVSQDEHLAEKLSYFSQQKNWHASLLGTWANITAYNEGELWLNETLDYLDHSRKLVAKLLVEYLPEARYRIPDATYLAWIDLSAYREDLPAKYIREQQQVAFSEGLDFGPSGAGYIRLNFATSQEIITEAIKRTAKALAN